ncbi:MAG TPA: thiamine phosphate synthase [Chryseolinea sp.]
MQQEFPYRLYLVTDEKACLGRDLIKITEAAVKGGVDLVQLREKDLNQKDFIEKALRLKQMLDRYNVPLIINDNLNVAKACRAAGIHVGNSDMSPVDIRREWPARHLIGYSIEDESQVTSAAASHADYLGISPVFSTPTKTDTVTEWGLDGIRKIRSLCSKPLVAIGGIKSDNAFAVITAGADCLAVVSAICSASDPARAAETIRMEIEKALK